MYEYHKASIALLDQILEANKKVLPEAIAWMAKTIIEDRIIHTFGTGHSHIIGLELFVSLPFGPSLGKVNIPENLIIKINN